MKLKLLDLFSGIGGFSLGLESTGYLLYKDQKKLIIFASHSFDDDGELTVGNTTTYPRSVVKKIERLK